MKAIRVHTFGPVERLHYDDVPAPEPGPGQVRVAVRAAGVHVLDTYLHEGDPAKIPFPVPDLPVIPGREVAGVVDALGDGVEESWLGRRVVAHLGLVNAGYAEFAVREVDALFPVPDVLDFPAAITMVGTGRAALGIWRSTEVRAGDTVLVTAAAGGVGTLLVQLAKAAGATVVGAAGGPSKTARVRAAGADRAVDYTSPGWGKEAGEVSVVFDGVGGEAGRAAFELLGPGGVHVVHGWAEEITAFTSVDLRDRAVSAVYALGPRMARRPGGMRALQEEALAEAVAGRLVPAVTTFPLAAAAAAHAALRGRKTVGKVVLLP
ncbi:zinc-binding dehydrogenase [Actinocorallia sp. API 0066]|uniref:zinc-binding dehydrogenase n=1 Tax=Actinocorallia sp. API 0066 TaxID=2896846 RepID=UPI001E5E2ADC|nr:zinc-binding dehydrogenase [Actinocorallia sp. API 0066]MCD0452629.1 zinc-binding dehydrogenase [Actinocorallia sp. API 0066]